MKALDAIIVVLSLAGVLVSMLALREHYSTATSPCSINDVWDCGAVNHSPYAAIHGLPVAAIGIMGYALLAALAGRFRLLTAIGAFAAFIFALRLTYIEARILETWCVYCLASQGIIALVFLLAGISVVKGKKGATAESEAVIAARAAHGLTDIPPTGSG